MARSYGGPARAERPRVRIDESGDARTLVVDETFASFYRSGEIATFCVWDAIAAPILWLPEARRRRILILGLGGGSVARLARALAPKAVITGIELDADVVRLARAHFELDALDVRVEVADALDWLEKAKGRYDVILEDVFIGRGDDVHKPDWIPHPAHDLARRRLAAGGVFVSNCLDEHARVAEAMRQAYRAVVSIGIEDYDNRVLAATDGALSAHALRRCVAQSPLLRDTLPILSFRTCSGDAASRG